MSKEMGHHPTEEPILDQKTARILLLVSGRAIETGGCLVSTELEQDGIGQAAFAIYEGSEEGTLSDVIEEVTGVPSAVDADTLAEMVAQSLVEHGIRLGMPPDEAEIAQIVV
jgi:hypothetical protein